MLQPLCDAGDIIDVVVDFSTGKKEPAVVVSQQTRAIGSTLIVSGLTGDNSGKQTVIWNGLHRAFQIDGI